jgi:diguanylate cyclase (GGDEF)-like protein
VFTVLRTAQLLLGVTAPPWLEYGFPFTMAFASIVITLGLADAILYARRERDIAHGLAERDGLTGAPNRRALTARLTGAIADARAQSRSFALLFLDIDHFKAINDRHGHLAGDICLKAVADAIGAAMKGSQYFGRYGGEEFLVLLPGASHAEAFAIGEQLRRRIEALTITAEGAQLRLTASIGIACLADSSDSAEQLISHADQALYRAKADGRNRVGMYTSPLAAAHL